MQKHQLLLGMGCQAGGGALMAATLVYADQKKFIVAPTIINVVSPAAERVRTAFFETSTAGTKSDKPCSACFEYIGGRDVAGAPSGSSFGDKDMSPSLRACLIGRCMVSRFISL